LAGPGAFGKWGEKFDGITELTELKNERFLTDSTNKMNAILPEAFSLIKKIPLIP
jgi:hypothetical protein